MRAHVRHDAIRDGEHGAGAQILQRAQDEQRGVAVVDIEGEAEIGKGVEGEGPEEDGTAAAAGGVGQWREQRGGEGLEDEVDGDGEVDQLRGGAEGSDEDGEEGKVDGRG